MKKALLLISMLTFLVCLFAISTSAVMIDGIDYSFNGNGEATVTSVNKGCTRERVEIPETVKNGEAIYTVAYISDSAFRGNGTVTYLKTPSTIKSIGEHAFREMSKLKEIVLNGSEDLKYLNNAEVYGCKELVKADLSGMIGLIDLGNGSTYDHTFTNCSKLSEVKLPSCLKVVGKSVFSGCSALANIELPEGLATIRGDAFNSTSIVSIKIPSTVNYIGDYAFQSCKSLEEINIPVGVTYFGCNNFQYTKVTKVVFPSTVTGAGKDMFNSVTCLDTVVLGNADVSNYNGTFFSSCGPLNYVFYAGNDASVLTNKFGALKDHELVSFTKYLENLRNPEFEGYKGKVLVYGTKNCASCGDVDTAEYGFIFDDLLSEMYMGAACPNCGAKSVNETYAPVFVDLGYSTSIINGKCSILQGFKINYGSIEKYNEMFPDAQIGEFGVLAVADRRVDDTAFDSEGNALDGVQKYELITKLDYFDIKINNIPADGMVDEETAFVDAKLHLCAYAFVGDKVYYVSENYVGETLGAGVSYNDKAL